MSDELIGSYENILAWVATFSSIGATGWRALALDYQAESYAVSTVSQAVLLVNSYRSSDRRMLLLNFFYLLTSAFAAYRWWQRRKQEASKQE